MQFNKFLIVNISLIFLIFFSFFLGFNLRENAVGGGPDFYNFTWPVIQSFKEDFVYTIKNYGTFGEGSYPLFHIINAYLNPFSNHDLSFQLSITVISFLVFFIFSLSLKKKFPNTNFIDLLLLSSIILLMPFFRTSAFWGQTENFGWLFLILAIYFFLEIKQSLFDANAKKNIFHIFLFCLFSASALYTRQFLVFLPISYLLYFTLFDHNKRAVIISIIFFAFLSTPGILLLIFWGGFYDVDNFPSYFETLVNPIFIIKNIPILLSYIGFYLLPIIVVELLNVDFKTLFKKYFPSFILTFSLLLVLSQLNFLNYLAEYEIGGGAILKLNYLIQKQNYFLLLIFSSIGMSILVRIINENIKNNLIILLPPLLIIGCANILYQEYVEPLILILFFLLVQTDLHKIFFRKIFLSNIILVSYFSIYLIGSIYFKHFRFDSFEKWMMYLNIQ